MLSPSTCMIRRSAGVARSLWRIQERWKWYGLPSVLVLDHRAAAHRRRDRHRGDGDERLLGALQDRRLALDVAEPVHQPPALDLEHLRHMIEALEVRVLRAPAHDVVDERAVDAGELGHLAGVHPQLLAAGLEPLGHRGAHG